MSEKKCHCFCTGVYVIHWWFWRRYQMPSYEDAFANDPDSKVHGANMKPTWVLSAQDGPYVGPMNLAIRGSFHFGIDTNIPTSLRVSSPCPSGNALKYGLSNGAMAFNSFHEPISGACAIQACIVSESPWPRLSFHFILPTGAGRPPWFAGVPAQCQWLRGNLDEPTKGLVLECPSRGHARSVGHSWHHHWLWGHGGRRQASGDGRRHQGWQWVGVQHAQQEGKHEYLQILRTYVALSTLQGVW